MAGSTDDTAAALARDTSARRARMRDEEIARTRRELAAAQGAIAHIRAREVAIERSRRVLLLTWPAAVVASTVLAGMAKANGVPPSGWLIAFAGFGIASAIAWFALTVWRDTTLRRQVEAARDLALQAERNLGLLERGFDPASHRAVR